ncbi:hypothetical protein NDU88_004240 [Pleurodeles waltl]|uniref:Uncharacterized protein n=1 Tax=Pleurodeles waltl TaxID=8319 RepID=A0AAV7MTD7_PLEWA|nr:hypothetical protein NDU88_004240 [Pleurodeles waltl]
MVSSREETEQCSVRLRAHRTAKKYAARQAMAPGQVSRLDCHPSLRWGEATLAVGRMWLQPSGSQTPAAEKLGSNTFLEVRRRGSERTPKHSGTAEIQPAMGAVWRDGDTGSEAAQRDQDASSGPIAI